jgi:hypothetical protein
MNNSFMHYQKGDLVTIKQKSMVLEKSSENGESKTFFTLDKPVNGVFLGVLADEDPENYEIHYGVGLSMKNMCKIAVGKSIYYVDERSFFFHNDGR